jgi:hypothetical protein
MGSGKLTELSMSQSKSFKSISIIALCCAISALLAVMVSGWVNVMLSLQSPFTAIVTGSAIIIAVLAGVSLALKITGESEEIDRPAILNGVKLICIIAAAVLVGYSIGHQIIGKEHTNLNLMIGFFFGLLQFATLKRKGAKAQEKPTT